jgi:ATP-dependent Clp protease ATP-binding subunit ClpA
MMFERFTTAARAVVIDAQQQAQTLHHREIRPDHLLLGVLGDDTSVSAGVLRDLGVNRESLLKEVASLGVADDEALRTIGIDLSAVREQAEAAFGPGALDRPRPRRGGLLRRVLPTGGDHIPFTSAAKRALEQSLRQAIALQHKSLTTDHILLGLLAEDDDPAARTLAHLKVDPAEVRSRVRDQLQRKAS